jgi:hypothetical protein
MLLENFVADDAGEVALLFCDINYFDDVIGECQDQIISIMDDIFRVFDVICNKVGIQKIEVASDNPDCGKDLHGLCRSEVR